MAISKEFQQKFSKQVGLFNEMHGAFQKLHRAFQSGQQEIDPNNPHSALKNEATFDAAHKQIAGELLADVFVKLDALKNEMAS